MRIRYKNNLSDILNFSLYTYVRSPLMLTLFSIYVILSSFTNLVDSLEEASIRSVVIGNFILSEGISIFVMLGILAIIIFLTVLSKKNKNYYIDKELSISKDGLTQTSEINKSGLKWEGVQKLASTRSYIYLYVNQFSAYIIPKRAFEHVEQWESFNSAVIEFSGKAT